jgi:hypothetical protein
MTGTPVKRVVLGTFMALGLALVSVPLLPEPCGATPPCTLGHREGVLLTIRSISVDEIPVDVPVAYQGKVLTLELDFADTRVVHLREVGDSTSYWAEYRSCEIHDC